MRSEAAIAWQSLPESFWLVFATIAAAIIGAVVLIATHLHTGRRAKRQRFIAACDKFRSAFAPTLGGVKSDNPTQFSSRAQEDAAIEEFRLFLAGSRRVDFDKACENYREYRKRAYPIPNAFGQIPARNDDVKSRFATALQCILSYADEP